MNAHKNTHAKNTNPPAYYILYTTHNTHWTFKHHPHMHCTYDYLYTTDSMNIHCVFLICLNIFVCGS